MVASIKEVLEQSANVATESQLVTSREAASILGVAKCTLTTWAQHGVIKPVVKGSRGRKASLFKLEDVRQLLPAHGPLSDSDELVTSKRIKELFGIRRQVLHRWTSSGRLEVVGIELAGKGKTKVYRLTDVQRLYDEHYPRVEEPQAEPQELVTTYEAASYIGVSRETIHYWKRKSWIRPAVTATRDGESDKYRLEELIEFASTKQVRGEGDASVPDDAVVSKLEASRIVGVRKETILNWLNAGLVSPIGRGKRSSYFRVGDLREVKHNLEAEAEADYFTHHRAYYNSIGDDCREIVHAMVASYKGEDESPEFIFADAVAAVMAALNCPLSCCVGLNRSQRIEKLKDFNRVTFAEPTVDRSCSDIYDEPSESFRLPYTAADRREAEKRQREEERLMWLRMSGKYQRWARDYNERLRSIEQIAR